MEIYADVVFLINLVMDCFILWVASKLARKKTKPLWLLMGGFIMSITYSLLVFLTAFQPYLNVFASILILMLGVVAAFRPKTAKEFGKIILLAYLASFAIGGIGVALFYFSNIGDVVGNMVGFSVDNFSWKMLLSATCGFYILLKCFMGWYKRRITQQQVFYAITIFLGHQNITLTALLDTGNSLEDPVTHAPVVVASFGAIKDLLPDNVKLVFYENREDDLAALMEDVAQTDFYGRIRMIPFASLGKQHGMLVGFRPDKVSIVSEDGGCVVTPNHVVVGIYNQQLDKEGRYHGLLHPSLLGETDVVLQTHHGT